MVSEDQLLGGRVRLRQPRGGYRAGADAVLLAAAVPARPGERVLDAGAGVGAVALSLARRLPDATVVALELQPAPLDLLRENVRLNGLEGRVEAVQGDIARPPAAVPGNGFDHVACNPPFHRPGTATAPPDPGRAAARLEAASDLADWLAFCLRCARPGGTVTLLHRAERLPDLLAGLRRGAGRITVYPFWPGRGRPAKLVLVQAVKGARAPLLLSPGLVLHEADGAYTEAAEAVLRHAEALRLRL